jgi:transposase InsO family protein
VRRRTASSFSAAFLRYAVKLKGYLTLENIAFERGAPYTLRFANGAELTSQAMLRWGAERTIDLHFIDPGKPTQNAHVESFNGRARDEFLKLHSFVTIYEACKLASLCSTK